MKNKFVHNMNELIINRYKLLQSSEFVFFFVVLGCIIATIEFFKYLCSHARYPPN